MDLRKKIFLIGGLSILFLVLLFLTLYFMGKKGKQTPIEQTNNTNNIPQEQLTEKGTLINNGGPVNKVIEGTKNIVVAQDEVYVKQLAGIFVERFNTYSNRNQNSHIDDALALSTEQMASWLKTQKINQSGEYVGATTQVLATNMKSFDKTNASVEVQVKETSFKGSSESVAYKNALVKLTKIDDEWKVSGFYWQE